MFSLQRPGCPPFNLINHEPLSDQPRQVGGDDDVDGDGDGDDDGDGDGDDDDDPLQWVSPPSEAGPPLDFRHPRAP